MNTIQKLLNQIPMREVIPYILIGGFATLIDWTVFSIATLYFHLHYQIALLCGYGLGGTFHYCTNKIITFKCRSKQIGSQLSLYVMTGFFSLGCNMVILGLLIKFFFLQKILARILTTALMVLPNYFLHKYITFNKRIFIQPAMK